MLFFRLPEYYVSGEIHHHYKVWDHILTGYRKREEILRYVSEGVSVYDFFQHFKGDFERKAYNSDIPPKAIFENSAICGKYEEFISNTLLERIRTGSMSVWGKRGQCEPPHLVMPMTVEPNKPRLCHDERFLNLWMRAPPVSIPFFETVSTPEMRLAESIRIVSVVVAWAKKL